MPPPFYYAAGLAFETIAHGTSVVVVWDVTDPSFERDVTVVDR